MLLVLPTSFRPCILSLLWQAVLLSSTCVSQAFEAIPLRQTCLRRFYFPRVNLLHQTQQLRSIWSLGSMTLTSSAPEGKDDMEKKIVFEKESIRILEAPEIQEYLNEMRNLLYHEDNIKNFELTLNEKHRRSMVRTILGICKVEYKELLRNLKTEIQWEMAECFIEKHLQPITAKLDSELTPNGGTFSFLASDELRQRYPQPAKFFSCLASGRDYKGKMEHLLEDLSPELLPEYLNIVANIPETTLLHIYVQKKQNQVHGSDDSVTSEQVRLLQRCLSMKFATPPPESADGGQAKGKRGELDLQSFLSAIYENRRTYQILSPVWIRPASAKGDNNTKKRHRNVLEVPADCMRPEMTAEFDTMVVFATSNVSSSLLPTTLTIEQVWDAKATLDPTAIFDVLQKKASSLQSILNPEFLPTTRFHLMNSYSGKETYGVGVLPNNSSPSLPQIGLFGSKFLTPRAAIRCLQVTVCERLLVTEVETVRRVLENDSGTLAPPREKVEQDLDRLARLVQEVQPVVVVPELR